MHVGVVLKEPKVMKTAWIASAAVLSAAFLSGCITPGVHELLPYRPTDYEEIERRLEAGANPNATDYEGITLLSRAALRGDLRLIEILLKHGANPDQRLRRRGGKTALHFAAYSGHDEVVAIFLEEGLDINITDRSGVTPLHMAAWGKRVSTIAFLLEKGADPMLRTSSGRTPLNSVGMSVESQENYLPTVKLLVEAGITVDVIGPLRRTALFDACYADNRETVEFLLEKGADPNHKDSTGRTPLMMAVSRSDPEVIMLLLDAGADKAARDDEGGTAMERAEERGDPGIIELLGNG